jgi:hypothetical protein
MARAGDLGKRANVTNHALAATIDGARVKP